jgi:ketopantoate reductase
VSDEATLLGAGEVGRVFLRAKRRVRVIRRGEAVEAAPAGTVLVAVREEDLGALVEPLRPVASRCAFVQNGLVDDVLAPLGEVTRGLVWFTAKGETFHVLAPSVFYGPRAEDCARWLGEAGVAARVEEDGARFHHEVARKLAWNNVAGLPPYVRKVTLGAYLTEHRDEARAVIDETLRVCAARWGTPVDTDDVLALVLATTGPIAGLRGGNKALAYRNGAVQRLGRALGVATPVNDALLASP